jgi:DNA-binding winged helix-turn-helix (wHTH) protein/tetratricopeptide (TPR) repeat protein
MTNPVYRFGNFVLDVPARELARDGVPVVLPSSAFDCLAYLVGHRERAVGRDELMAAIWGRADVADTLLGQTVVRVRRAIGDDGGRQGAIRTVPRFGYRWVAPASVDTGDDSADPAAATPATAPSLPAAIPAPRARAGMRIVAGVVGVLVLGILIAVALRRVQAPDASAEVANATTPAMVAPALVLPATIDADGQWDWLRLGMMDLIAQRLRRSDVPTVPSESVVRILRHDAATDGATLLGDPALAQVAALRILPEIARHGGRWSVELEASGRQRTLAVSADGDDVIATTRLATDRLLAALGRRPIDDAHQPSPPVQVLLQQSGAAMLADQLDAARRLIADAPEPVRDNAQVQWRLAQVELRSGAYDAVERRAAVLLDRVGAGDDPALRARILLTLAAASVRQNRFDDADTAYEEAIALRRGSNDHEALGIAHLGRGIVLAQKSRFDEAVAEFGRARIALAGTGDALGIAQVDVNLGDLESLRHRPAEALPHLRAAAAAFDHLDAREGMAYALASMAEVQRRLLQPQAALATIERVWPAQEHVGNPRLRWNVTLVRADVLTDLGRLHEAQALLVPVDAESDRKLDATVRAQAVALAVRIAALQGDATVPTRAGAALTPVLEQADPRRYARTWMLRIASLGASGDADEADGEARRFHAWATASPDPWRAICAGRVAAGRDWAAGRHDSALSRYAKALEQAAALGIPEDRVAVAVPYVQALIDAGHLDEASAVAGGIAPWASSDFAAALVQARLFAALGRTAAWRSASANAARLAGERRLPADTVARVEP